MAHPSFIVAVVLEQAGQGHKQQETFMVNLTGGKNNNNLARGAFQGGRSEPAPLTSPSHTPSVRAEHSSSPADNETPVSSDSLGTEDRTFSF